MTDDLLRLQSMTRRDAIRAAGGLVLVGGSVLGLAGCGSSGSGAGTVTNGSTGGGTVKRGGSIQVAVGDAATSENLDPQRPWNQNNGLYVPLAWDTLIQLDEQFNLHPSLATSWHSNAAATQWTFVLRQGVKFHDGTPMTSADVVWSMRRLFETSLASPIYGPLAAVVSAKGIAAKDAHTVVVDLLHPDAFFPVIFAQTGTEIIKAGQNVFTLSNAVGTGPFRFTSFQAGQGWTVARNADYWQTGFPYLDQIRGVSIPDPTALVDAVTSGSSDLTTSVAFSQVPVIQSSGNSVALVAPAFFDSYIVMNAKLAPFGDVRVRQAVKLADNRRRVLAAAYQGNGVLTSDTPVPSTDPFYPSGLGIRAQEISQAKSLLAQAGYPNGIDLTLYTSDLLGGMVDMAVAFAQMVAPAGIRVNVKQHPAATYFEQVWLQEAFYCSWVYRKHPAVRVPQTLASYSAWRETNIPHTKVDSLLASALAATSPTEQKARMGTLLTWIADNDGYVSAAFENMALAAKKTLQGVEFPQGKGPSLVRAWVS